MLLLIVKGGWPKQRVGEGKYPSRRRTEFYFEPLHTKAEDRRQTRVNLSQLGWSRSFLLEIMLRQ